MRNEAIVKSTFSRFIRAASTEFIAEGAAAASSKIFITIGSLKKNRAGKIEDGDKASGEEGVITKNFLSLPPK